MAENNSEDERHDANPFTQEKLADAIVQLALSQMQISNILLVVDSRMPNIGAFDRNLRKQLDEIFERSSDIAKRFIKDVP